MFNVDIKLRRNVHWTDWLTYPLASMVSQDTLYWFRDMPRNSSGSILVGIWSISNFLLYLSYISNFQVISVEHLYEHLKIIFYLKASLIAVGYEAPLDSNYDLINRNITPLLMDGSSMIEQMKTSPIESERILYQMSIDGNGFWTFKGSLPWSLLDIMVETGKQCLIITDQVYINNI